MQIDVDTYNTTMATNTYIKICITEPGDSTTVVKKLLTMDVYVLFIILIRYILKYDDNIFVALEQLLNNDVTLCGML